MKVAICLLIKDENEYLDEWLNHHRKLGITQFYIYDNHSAIPIQKTLSLRDCEVKLWDDQGVNTQVAAYNDCCRNHPDDDFILFIDTDEFLMINCNFKTVEQVIRYLKHDYGEFSALGIYWRIYGKTKPYFKTRRPVEDYTQYLEYTHIKTVADPKLIKRFNNPHYAIVMGNYISETGKPITGPFSNFHSSKLIWIKHLFTRSLREFEEKIKRGSGDKVNRLYNLNHYYQYNDHCNLSD